jgi:hypothetical protein
VVVLVLAERDADDHVVQERRITADCVPAGEVVAYQELDLVAAGLVGIAIEQGLVGAAVLIGRRGGDQMAAALQ